MPFPSKLPVDPEVEALKKKLPWTPPFDPRFPNTNQKRNCTQNYLDFHRCQKKLGEEDEKCTYYKKAYRSLCPTKWTDHWDEQMAENRFPVRL